MHGRREQLVGTLQELYGITKEEAEKQINEFIVSVYSIDDDMDAHSEVQTENRRHF